MNLKPLENEGKCQNIIITKVEPKLPNITDTEKCITMGIKTAENQEIYASNSLQILNPFSGLWHLIFGLWKANFDCGTRDGDYVIRY